MFALRMLLCFIKTVKPEFLLFLFYFFLSENCKASPITKITVLLYWQFVQPRKYVSISFMEQGGKDLRD